MSNYVVSTPRWVTDGMSDVSGRQVPVTPRARAQHIPHIYILAPKGDTDARIVSGIGASKMYGTAITDVRSPYTTHAFPLLEDQLQLGAVSLQRLKPADATTATIRFWLDVLSTEELPLYERMPDGSFALDNSLQKIPTGTTTDGVIARWTTEVITSAAPIGEATQRQGDLTEGATRSVQYPMFDIPAKAFGEYYNRTGICMWAPTTMGTDPINTAIPLENKSYIYRFMLKQRETNRSNELAIPTIGGGNFVEFSLHPDAWDSTTRTSLFADDVVASSYDNPRRGADGLPTVSNMGDFFVYHDNVKTVSELMFANERSYGTVPDEDGYELMINLLSAKSLQNVPYYSVELQGIANGGIEFNNLTVHHLSGGSDGTMGNQVYNDLVAEQLENFGDLEVKYGDIARYPMTVFYDTGFDDNVKGLIPNILSVRRGMSVALATQDVMMKPLTPIQDSSVAVGLRARLRAVPESVVHGTSTVRGVIWGQVGKLLQSSYNKWTPLTVQLARWRARFLGSESGVAINRYGYDLPGQNIVDMMDQVTNTYKTDDVRDNDWSNGLNWVQYFDEEALFVPACRTIYDDDTSVLVSDMNMLFAVTLTQIGFEVWRMLVGRTDLDEEGFIQESNRLIAEYSRNRFDNRIVVVPDTFFTRRDELRGYSVSANINMYANNMRTVYQTTVVTHRMSDLQLAA